MCNQHPADTTPKTKDIVWRPDDNAKATPARPGSSEIFRPDILETIEAKIAELDPELRALSLDIHGLSHNTYVFAFSRSNNHPAHPELGYKE